MRIGANTMIIYYPAKPKPAPRPRVTKFGTYNDNEYTQWKNGLKLLAKTKIKRPLQDEVFMNIEFFYEIPQSWSKKKKEEAKWHKTKPDIDNLIKSVMDSLNGIAFKDDSQVVMIKARKQYASFNGVQITINE